MIASLDQRAAQNVRCGSDRACPRTNSSSGRHSRRQKSSPLSLQPVKCSRNYWLRASGVLNSHAVNRLPYRRICSIRWKGEQLHIEPFVRGARRSLSARFLSCKTLPLCEPEASGRASAIYLLVNTEGCNGKEIHLHKGLPHRSGIARLAQKPSKRVSNVCAASFAVCTFPHLEESLDALRGIPMSKDFGIQILVPGICRWQWGQNGIRSDKQPWLHSPQTRPQIHSFGLTSPYQLPFPDSWALKDSTWQPRDSRRLARGCTVLH